jgi:acyl-CoA reductase-like NAD-dependent aldehyde dehydrogenase
MNLTLPPEVSLQPGTLNFLESGPKKLLINGRWVESLNSQTFDTLNPATGEQLAEVALAGVEDVERAVQAARAAFEMGPWGQMGGEDRGQFLWKLAELVEAHADELAELETLDNGKPLRVARKGDLVYAAKHIRYNAGLAGKIEGATIPVSYPNQLVYTLREPFGVVGLIIPWNFPLLTACWKLSQALACGNTVILKPAEETPLTALRVGELILEAGFPNGVVNILTGPGEPTGAAITQNMGIDKVSFTGSTEVGRRVMEAAARSNLKSVSLELGANPQMLSLLMRTCRKPLKAPPGRCSAAPDRSVSPGRGCSSSALSTGGAGRDFAEAQRIRVGNGLAPKSISVRSSPTGSSTGY